MRFLARRLFPSLVVSVLALFAAAGQAGAALPAVKVQQFTSPDQVPQGLAKSDWTSIRTAYEAGRHAFEPTATGWQARNPGQQWTTQFDRRGFLASPRDGGWTWGLELLSYGFPGVERVIHGVPAVQADGQRKHGGKARCGKTTIDEKRHADLPVGAIARGREK